MFLIEGQGKAILYTGDIRAEPWFVNALARNPGILEYTCGLKTLDKIYLDTSFLADIPFQTKSEGIADLLAKVQRYPEDTVFHFQAWTFGYEDVWIALSKALNSRIHVDDYKLRIFNSLKSRSSDQPFSPEFHLAAGAAVLTGHMCGNTQHLGCLTSDTSVRIHSCEKANMCSVAKHPSVVSIRPVVCRLPGGESMMEKGVGGGGTDLSREAEFDCITHEDVYALLESLPAWNQVDSETRKGIKAMLTSMSSSGRDFALNMSIEEFSQNLSADMSALIQSLANRLSSKTGVAKTPVNEPSDSLPRVILFPFARHSPYRELCELVKVFSPKDIWPCTVDKQWVEKTITMESLFGKYCSKQIFEHDKQMAPLIAQEHEKRSREVRTPMVDSQCDTSFEVIPQSKRIQEQAVLNRPQLPNALVEGAQAQTCHPAHASSSEEPSSVKSIYSDLHSKTRTGEDHVSPSQHEAERGEKSSTAARKQPYQELDDPSECSQDSARTDSQMADIAIDSVSSLGGSALRRDAYKAMLNNTNEGGAWVPISLLSTDANHHEAEVEL
ncbi:artemis protein [Metarhizium robertsii ARSEF 23]|nr:artemis protein [Metarhizium robertsii ARSEF 23]EFZ02339.1 artemis protein [Metarhizium robertsii ARSEF 23]